jgi:hypothetical protein
MRTLVTLVKLIACVGALSLMLIAGASAATKRPVIASVVVPHGQPVQITLAADVSGFASSLEPSIEQAVRLAIVAHPDVHGFPIRLNVVDAPCGNPAGDVAAATSVVANTQNVGVLGQFCSGGFDQALPIYQAAGVVVISGSATSDTLPQVGPTVFDRTIVRDGDGGNAWFGQVTALPRYLAWEGAVASLFGSPPTDFAGLYYDATRVLIRSVTATSWVDGNGNLVLNRGLLAFAVRHTTNLRGISCTITIDPATGNRVNDPKSLARCGS